MFENYFERLALSFFSLQKWYYSGVQVQISATMSVVHVWDCPRLNRGIST